MWELPLINTEEYNHTGLWVNGIGCVIWCIFYATLIREIRKKKFVEMPAYVAGANLAWEFVWSTFYHPTTGLLYSLAYICAFVLDLYIFYSIIKYGTKQPMSEPMKKHFVFFAFGNLGFWILFNYFFISEGYDTMVGANSGYIISVILSLQCVAMLFQTSDTKDFSLLLAWSKMIGTGLISLSMFFFYPENHFVQLLGTASFILDNIFIGTLIKRHGKWI